MKLDKLVQKIPGGTLLLPMALAAVLNTAYPDIREIGPPFSSLFTTTGTMLLIAVILVFIGMQFDVRPAKKALRKGGVLIGLKLFIAILFGLVVMKFFGRDGFWGLSTLTLVTVVASTNPAIYLALMESHGDENDRANFTLLNIIGLPFVPICILDFSAGSSIDYRAILSTLLPFLVGILLRFSSTQISKISTPGIKLTLPFLGFCLGANINLIDATGAIVLGTVLFLVFALSNHLPLILTDRLLLKQKGHVAVAISCVAGLSVAIPDLMAQIDKSYLPYVDDAKAQIAFVVLLSTLITPFLVARFLRKDSR